MRYIVTKEIKSETQIGLSLYARDLALLVIWAGLILAQRENVHSLLQIPYLLFSAVIGVRMVLPSRGNPKRRYYQSIALYLMRPKTIQRYYKEEGKLDEEGKGNQTHQRRHTYYRV